MVRTRHHPGADGGNDDSPVQFLCLETKSSRRSQIATEDDYNSDDSGVVQKGRGRSHQSLEHVQTSFQSRLRPKIRSSGAYFIGEGISSDDEVYMSGGSPSRSRRSGHSSRRRKRSSSGRHKRAAIEHITDELPQLNGEVEDEEEEEGPDDENNNQGGSSRRRSTRQRKMTYDTLNQTFLDKAVVSAKGVERKLDRGKKRRSHDQVDPAAQKDEFSDMYSRVKRQRKHVERDMYGVPIHESSDTSTSESDSNDEEENDEGNEEEPKRSYYLREHKPRTQLFEAPPIESQKKKTPTLFRDSPPRSSRTLDSHKTYNSPAHRKKIVRKRAAFHRSSSTSSDNLDSDEDRFQRRKAKSMARSRSRCLPMNLTKDDIAAVPGVYKDRMKIGASLADIDPMAVDKSVNFSSVGGLGKHIRSLKEMIVFPIMYPEIFERFKISPPRGVLFYGPPGTGKTLIARALANECSTGERRVAFFMRKGADCLSKWVGESERQLRLLFDQAYQMRPSIIFFDEIDGLAPVRSSRQDQIHSSIVSTLLALMDGLDSRGEIVVIGATNRIDSIDPALRRPGRFDREFLFPLPSQEARKHILKIHTRAWVPKLSDGFIGELAQRCVGYCGADLKALCTEAALQASRRRYPQIYTSNEKLQLNVSSILVTAKDFFKGMQAIVPTAQRSVTSPSRALSVTVEPLLKHQFQSTQKQLHDIFPMVLSKLSSLDAPVSSSQEDQSGEITLDDLGSDDEDDDVCIYEKHRNKKRSSLENSSSNSYLSFGRQSYQCPTTYRPRLLLCGKTGQGQTSHMGPAVLHYMEQLPVHVLDLPTVFAATAKTPEESCAQVFREAKRCSPSIVYMPYINQWWEVLSETLRATFLTMVQDLDPATPLLIVATSEMQYDEMDTLLQVLFDQQSGEVVEMRDPHPDERREYFHDLLMNQAVKPPPLKKQAVGNETLWRIVSKLRSKPQDVSPSEVKLAMRMLEVLPKAPPPAPPKLTEAEAKKLHQQEEATLRELRIFLRDVLNKLGRDRKFSIFTKPVDVEDVPDYYEIIQKPMDLSTMMSKIDLHHYMTVAEFLGDINQICLNALEYNPDRDPSGKRSAKGKAQTSKHTATKDKDPSKDRAIRHRACALRDTAQAIIEAELDPEFEKLCQSICDSRTKKGTKKPANPVPFYFTKPLAKPAAAADQDPILTHNAHHVSGTRSSRRVQGIHAEDLPPLELVEKQWQIEKRQDRTPSKENQSPSSPTKGGIQSNKRQHSETQKNTHTSSKTLSNLAKKPKKKKCIWAGTKRRRRRFSSAKKVKVSPVPKDAMLHVDIEDEETDNGDSDDSDSEIVIAESPRRRDNPDSGSKLSPGHASSGKDNASNSPKYTSSRKPPTSRCLDLIPASQDSGVGSSLDSNGDSVDSIDHAKEKDRKQHDSSCVDQEMLEESQDTDSRNRLRLTRSRIQNKEQQRALDLLEQTLPPVIVDLPRLQRLLDKVVIVTDQYNVEQLEKLYSVFSQIIYKYRRDYDKTQLTEDLESKLDQHSKQCAAALSNL